MLANAEWYSMERRRRRWALSRLGFNGPESDISAIAGAEVAAFSGPSSWGSIGVGVTTGVLTFVLTRIIEKILFAPTRRPPARRRAPRRRRR